MSKNQPFFNANRDCGSWRRT